MIKYSRSSVEIFALKLTIRKRQTVGWNVQNLASAISVKLPIVFVNVNWF